VSRLGLFVPLLFDPSQDRSRVAASYRVIASLLLRC
jgi:hypothetical protein